MRLPKCDCCIHYHEGVEDRMCCDAFPDGIPDGKITWGDFNVECANGIKYEDENGEYKEFIPEAGSLLARMHRI